MPPVQQREFYGVRSLLSAHPAMRALRRQGFRPSLHGNKHWGAASILMDFLQDYPLQKGCRVLDIGCGLGLAGIYCARHFEARLTAVDADPAVAPYLELHAELNAVPVNFIAADMFKLDDDILADSDVLIASDICFWDEMMAPLAELIERAIQLGVGQILIADPQRPPFIALAEHCVEAWYAELYPRRAQTSRSLQGTVMLIENR